MLDFSGSRTGRALLSEAGKLVCQESAANCYVINTKVSVTEHCHCDVCVCVYVAIIDKHALKIRTTSFPFSVSRERHRSLEKSK